MREFDANDIQYLETGRRSEQSTMFAAAIPTTNELRRELKSIGKWAIGSALIAAAGYGARRFGQEMEKGPLVSKAIGRGVRLAGNTALAAGLSFTALSGAASLITGYEYIDTKSAEKSGKVQR